MKQQSPGCLPFGIPAIYVFPPGQVGVPDGEETTAVSNVARSASKQDFPDIWKAISTPKDSEAPAIFAAAGEKAVSGKFPGTAFDFGDIRAGAHPSADARNRGLPLPGEGETRRARRIRGPRGPRHRRRPRGPYPAEREPRCPASWCRDWTRVCGRYRP